MSTITPFLWFDAGQLDEALRFYASVFEGARVVSRGPSSAELELLGQPFLALAAERRDPFTEAISLFVSCRDQAEVDYYWSALTADGGAESRCGWLTDRFGVSWQVIPETLSRCLGDPDPARAQRALAAMLKMSKIVVADLEAAVAG